MNKMFPDLIEELKQHPDNSDNWNALFHYKKYIDGELGTIFYRDCFILFLRDCPMLLLEQYRKNRDPRILKLLQDTIYKYSPDLSGCKDENYPAKKASLDSAHKMISEQAQTDESRVFLEVMEAYNPLYLHGYRWSKLASDQIIEQVTGGNSIDNKWSLLARLLEDELRVGNDQPNELEALFLYENSLVPAELSRFYQNCFFLYFDENPYLLYRRYAEIGDARLLELAKRLIEWYDPVVMNHQGASGEYKKTHVAEAVDMIKKEKPSTERELEFLQTIESTWKHNPKKSLFKHMLMLY